MARGVLTKNIDTPHHIDVFDFVGFSCGCANMPSWPVMNQVLSGVGHRFFFPWEYLILIRVTEVIPSIFGHCWLFCLSSWITFGTGQEQQTEQESKGRLEWSAMSWKDISKCQCRDALSQMPLKSFPTCIEPALLQVLRTRRASQAVMARVEECLPSLPADALDRSLLAWWGAEALAGKC